MRVRLVSDLHLEFCQYGHGVPNIGEGDTLILGGDILCAKHFKTDGPLHKVYDDFLQKCVENFDEVLYVNGNHEAYGYNYEGSFNVIKDHLPPSIHYLENDYVKIKDMIFLGCTLWTDFRNENALEMMEAAQCMNDYKVIRIGPNYRKMTPDDTLNFHKKSKRFLIEKLEEFKDTKTWVLTHHSPSFHSVHPKYKKSGIANGAYSSDLDELILSNPQIKFWSHGHTHESFDYMIGECRVLCNPRGYYNGYNNRGLNLNFNPNFEVLLD
jgi:predicted phosphohydrolase